MLDEEIKKELEKVIIFGKIFEFIELVMKKI